MNIFENLEQLNVSEECFEEIMNIVEDIVSYAQKLDREKNGSTEHDLQNELINRYKNNLAQAKSVRRHFSKQPYSLDVDYKKLDNNVSDAVDNLKRAKELRNICPTDVKDFKTPEGKRKQEAELQRKENYIRGRKERIEKGYKFVKKLDPDEEAFLKQRDEQKQKKPSLISKAEKALRDSQERNKRDKRLRQLKYEIETSRKNKAMNKRA